MKLYDTAIIILYIIIIIILLTGLHSYTKKLNICNANGKEILFGESLNGFYNYEGYYCVNEQGTYAETMETQCHEACHSMINKNYEHFCEGARK